MLKPMDAATQAKAQATRKARIEAGKAAYYPKSDALLWASLAKERGLRLPPTWKAPTPNALSGWAKRLKKPDLPAGYGFRTWTAYIKANPGWSLRDMVGLMLE